MAVPKSKKISISPRSGVNFDYSVGRRPSKIPEVLGKVKVEMKITQSLTCLFIRQKTFPYKSNSLPIK
jgi:hypothetical protein